MASRIYPKRGHILLCDFNRGFVPPEMVKIRPVAVLSPTAYHGSGLCTVVPLSTTAPNQPKPWHYLFSHNPLSPDGEPVWAKCDLVTSVSIDRLAWPYIKTRQERRYQSVRLSLEELTAIEDCVRRHLGL